MSANLCPHGHQPRESNMASISTYTYDKPITVRRSSHQAEPWQAVKMQLAGYLTEGATHSLAAREG